MTGDARAEIARLRASGQSWRAVAHTLNQAGIPTPTGRGSWWPQTVMRHADQRARSDWSAYIARYRQRIR